MKTERAGWRADDIASLSSNSFSGYSAQQRVFTATPLIVTKTQDLPEPHFASKMIFLSFKPICLLGLLVCGGR